MKKNHIVHLTSAHTRYDTRIFIKQCCSLARTYNVSLVVADGLGYEKINNVEFYDVGRLTGRFNRIFKTTRNVFDKAIQLDADLYHLHDPELIPIGLKLLKNNKKVIFDAHEDLPIQILSKPYLPNFVRYPLSKLVKQYEKISLKKFSGIVSATPYIRNKFKKINNNTIDINNYPKLEEFISIQNTFDSKDVCYVGGITKVRGIEEVVDALTMTNSDINLLLAGNFSEVEFKAFLEKNKGWEKVSELGFLDREGIKNTLGRSIAGLVTLHPITNYLDALPVKMFEYMAAGLPVIASDFPLWRNIIDESASGICVDSLNPQSIAEAIDYLISNPEKARLMGVNGRNAVKQQYNWDIEQEKLYGFYEEILN